MNPTPPPMPKATPEDGALRPLKANGTRIQDASGRFIAEAYTEANALYLVAELNARAPARVAGEGDACLLRETVKEFLNAKSVARSQVLLGRMRELTKLPAPGTGATGEGEDWIEGTADEICETLDLDSVVGVSPQGTPTAQSAKDFIAKLIRRYAPNATPSPSPSLPALRLAEEALRMSIKRDTDEGQCRCWGGEECQVCKQHNAKLSALASVRAAIGQGGKP